MKKWTVAVITALVLGGVSLAAAETCFFDSERSSGMNKICFYSCISGPAAITISAVKLCPLSIKR